MHAIHVQKSIHFTHHQKYKLVSPLLHPHRLSQSKRNVDTLTAVLQGSTFLFFTSPIRVTRALPRSVLSWAGIGFLEQTSALAHHVFSRYGRVDNEEDLRMIMSAGVVVVREEHGTWRFLFLRAYKNWDFPKGIVAGGEDPLETAKRELREEAGITDLKFPWGKISKDTLPYRSKEKKITRYYVGQTSQTRVTFSVNPELGRPEHHEYRWATCDEIRMLAPERLLPIIEWANRLTLNG